MVNKFGIARQFAKINGRKGNTFTYPNLRRMA